MLTAMDIRKARHRAHALVSKCAPDELPEALASELLSVFRDGRIAAEGGAADTPCQCCGGVVSMKQYVLWFKTQERTGKPRRGPYCSTACGGAGRRKHPPLDCIVCGRALTRLQVTRHMTKPRKVGPTCSMPCAGTAKARYAKSAARS